MAPQSSTLILAFASVAAAAKKAEAAPPPNAIVEYVTNLVMPVSDACIALATDVVGLSLAVPNALVDLFVYAIDKAREMPDLAMNVKNGDGKTLDDLSSFAADMASIVFCVYASLAALNLAVQTAIAVKDYFVDYMVLPTKVPIVDIKLPGPILNVRDVIQTELLNRIRTFRCGTIIPLEGGGGTLNGALKAMASVTSTCVVLGCAPSIHASIKGSANKAASEALIYTLGMGVGLSWLVKKVA
jgi:hypothetical protein